jgi:CubicO group peptidase (beta-lactamase class C family)
MMATFQEAGDPVSCPGSCEMASSRPAALDGCRLAGRRDATCRKAGGCLETVPAERELTIRDLLTHTSGLMSGPISNRESGKVALKPQETLADFLPRLKSVPLEFQPGSRWAYSPTGGFDVLARVIEVASGRTVDQFFRERIFEPLGMKDTFFYPVDGNPRLVTPYAAASNVLEKRAVPNFIETAVMQAVVGDATVTGSAQRHE